MIECAEVVLSPDEIAVLQVHVDYYRDLPECSSVTAFMLDHQSPAMMAGAKRLKERGLATVEELPEKEEWGSVLACAPKPEDRALIAEMMKRADEVNLRFANSYTMRIGNRTTRVPAMYHFIIEHIPARSRVRLTKSGERTTVELAKSGVINLT